MSLLIVENARQTLDYRHSGLDQAAAYALGAETASRCFPVTAQDYSRRGCCVIASEGVMRSLGYRGGRDDRYTAAHSQHIAAVRGSPFETVLVAVERAFRGTGCVPVIDGDVVHKVNVARGYPVILKNGEAVEPKIAAQRVGKHGLFLRPEQRANLYACDRAGRLVLRLEDGEFGDVARAAESVEKAVVHWRRVIFAAIDSQARNVRCEAAEKQRELDRVQEELSSVHKRQEALKGVADGVRAALQATTESR